MSLKTIKSFSCKQVYTRLQKVHLERRCSAKTDNKRRIKMKPDNTTNEILDWFTRGIFPTPYTFTDQQIESVGNIAGVDARGTFADAPMEQALLREYKLNIRNGENTWPAFAEALRDEKDIHFSRFSGARESSMKCFKEAIANCLVFGVSPEEIVEQAKNECAIPC
jgi:hypothetical protein